MCTITSKTDTHNHSNRVASVRFAVKRLATFLTYKRGIICKLQELNFFPRLCEALASHVSWRQPRVLVLDICTKHSPTVETSTSVENNYKSRIEDTHEEEVYVLSGKMKTVLSPQSTHQLPKLAAIISMKKGSHCGNLFDIASKVEESHYEEAYFIVEFTDSSVNCG